MNAASILGRTLPNIVADKVGVLNILIVMTLGTGAMVFALLGATSVGYVTMFSILYGFFSGSGQSGFCALVIHPNVETGIAVWGLLGPVTASLTPDVSQLG
jgi:hypothetical protein